MKCIIVEGFEFTGKTHYIRTEYSSNPLYITYRPNYEELNSVFSYNDRWIYGWTILDLINNSINQDKEENNNSTIVLDRGFPSSVVYLEYCKEKGKSIDTRLTNEIINNYASLIRNTNTRIVYCHHSNKENAKIMYEMSISDSKHKDTYDHFNDFDDYWDKYIHFDKLYNKCFVKYGIKHLVSYHSSTLQVASIKDTNGNTVCHMYCSGRGAYSYAQNTN